MARRDGIVIQNSPAATLDGVESSLNGNAGVRIELGAGATGRTVVKGGTFSGNWVYGINAINAPNVDVVSNVVTDTGMSGSAAFMGSDLGRR
jgi:hypothetical protein